MIENDVTRVMLLIFGVVVFLVLVVGSSVAYALHYLRNTKVLAALIVTGVVLSVILIVLPYCLSSSSSSTQSIKESDRNYENYRVGNVIDCAFGVRYKNANLEYAFWSDFKQSHWPTHSLCHAIMYNKKVEISPLISEDVYKKVQGGVSQDPGFPWLVYDYDMIGCCILDYRSFLRTVTKKHVGQFLLAAKEQPRDDVLYIHARVGDFIKLGIGVISPICIVRTIKQMSKHFTKINVMDGGGKFLMKENDNGVTETKGYLRDLVTRLETEFQDTVVDPCFDAVKYTNNETNLSPVDLDWLCLATAKNVICSVGSFAITAMIGNIHDDSNLWSPSVSHLNFASRGVLSSEVRENFTAWNIYTAKEEDIIHTSPLV